MVGIIALFALVVGSSAFEVDLNLVAKVSDTLHDYVSSSLRTVLHEHAIPDEVPFHELTNASTCKQCVGGGAEIVLRHTVTKVNKMCSAAANKNASDARSCMIMKMCAHMAKHEKVVMGMMVEHVRPFALSTAYCTGSGACKKPSEVTMEEIAMGSQPHGALLDKFDKTNWNDFEEAEDLVMPVVTGGTGDAPVCKLDPGHHSKVCPMCMKRVMRHTMGKAAMKAMHMCKNAATTKCPVVKKMCPWAMGNMEMAMGMLAAKVEPWKFAHGFCRAMAKMHHGPHGPMAKLKEMAKAKMQKMGTYMV